MEHTIQALTAREGKPAWQRNQLSPLTLLSPGSFVPGHSRRLHLCVNTSQQLLQNFTGLQKMFVAYCGGAMTAEVLSVPPLFLKDSSHSGGIWWNKNQQGGLLTLSFWCFICGTY